MQSPLKIFGGKRYLAKQVLEHMPSHNLYVEVFGGAGHVLFAKPIGNEVFNDIDSAITNFFMVLRDNFDEFVHEVTLMPVSREQYYDFRKNWLNESNRIKRAAKWFCMAYQSFSGDVGHSFGFSLLQRRGINMTASQWLSAVERLPETVQRLRTVLIENRDFREIFKTYDRNDTLFYLDPPYLPDTRSWGKYKHEMATEDHEEMLDLVLNLQGKIMISGYKSKLYDDKLKDWKRITFDVSCRSEPVNKKTNKRQIREEVLWISPNSENFKQLSFF